MTDAGCQCLACAQDLTTRDAFLVEEVSSAGFARMAVETTIPFVFTIGLWHTFRRPEVVMFGLHPSDMNGWLKKYVDLSRHDTPSREGDLIENVIQGFPVQVRPVDRSWNDSLFGTLHRFYQGVVPPVEQLIWPDREGLWPWDDRATESCRKREAQAWLPVAEHPDGGWRLVGEMGVGFPLSGGPDQEVLTTRDVITGVRKIAAVVNVGGMLDVLDERLYRADEYEVAYLGDLARTHAALLDFDDSREGYRGILGPNSRWTYRPVSSPDRKASAQIWQKLESDDESH
ncbi:DUF4262 domain-containing protein [Micromonospora sp. NPDC050417]|uniref:DUF4262 domain-containing protein n=1 Tax=Micromonospora sp. NPDC050417 TaxID=3364280 RepID=UPI0037BA3BC1